jgi:3-hydroxybutyryl-CoA dehydrogenase
MAPVSTVMSRVGVVGLGTMGAGIAQLCIEAGFETVGCEPMAAAREQASERVAYFVGRKVEKGMLDAGAADAALARLELTAAIADLAGCDCVLEAVVEDLPVKRAVFGELEAVVAAGALIATNTSALSVTSIASALGRPGRALGIHFFNPAPLMPLVEVVRGERTAPAAVETAVELARRLGKTPIVCDDTPGFVVNRTLIPLLNDCIRVLDETAVSPEDLDEALRLGAGWPMGPTRLLDLIGLDVHLHASEALYQRLREPRMAPPPRLARLVEAGKLGRKTGEGFHAYDEAHPAGSG